MRLEGLVNELRNKEQEVSVWKGFTFSLNVFKFSAIVNKVTGPYYAWKQEISWQDERKPRTETQQKLCYNCHKNVSKPCYTV
jgi:hypothetical protein